MSGAWDGPVGVAQTFSFRIALSFSADPLPDECIAFDP